MLKLLINQQLKILNLLLFIKEFNNKFLIWYKKKKEIIKIKLFFLD